MNIDEMTRKDFEALPFRKNWDSSVECDSIIILPGRSKDIHDSGYRKMDFVAVKDNKPICLLSGRSNVIYIDGIGGCGLNWLEVYKTVPSCIPPRSWNIDCLKKSGLLRLFCIGTTMIAGEALSSFEIYADTKKEVKR